jgi:signal transduction histidine kinase
MPIPILIIFLAGAAIAGLALWVVFLSVQAKKARLERADHSLEAEKARAILETTPDGLFIWDKESGQGFCSRRLAVLLDLPSGAESRFEDLVAGLDAASAETLLDAVVLLRRDARSFEVLVSAGEQNLRVLGMTAGDNDGHPLADLLWFRPKGEKTDTKEDGLPAFQKLLDILPFPVWLRDRNLDVLFTNRTGSSAAITTPSRPLAEQALSQNQASAETHLITIAETSRMMEITETPLSGSRGTLGFALDRSSIEESDTQHSRRINAVNQVFELLPFGVAIFDLERRLTFANAAYASIWRLDKRWLETHPSFGEILELLRKQRRLPEVTDFKAFKDQQQSLFETLEAPEEKLLHLPDETMIKTIAAPHPGGGLVSICEDVTKTLGLERSLNTLSAVQGVTLDNLYEAIAVFGGDGRLKLHNPAFGTLWKLDEDAVGPDFHLSDFVEKTLPFLDGVDDSTAYKKASVAEFLSRRAASRRIFRHDGLILDCANVPLPDGAALLSYLDVTDSAKVEHALRQRAEALEEAGRLKSEFIANVSYEVRTPLTSLIGFSETLVEEYFGTLNPRQMEYCRNILEASQGLMSVISDILDLASIEAGTMTLDLDTVEIHPLLASLLGLVRERVKRKGIELAFDCPADIGWMVADEKRLKQILFNLLCNAVAFTPDAGHIRLEVMRQNDHAVFTISDSGSGIPKDDQERIFQMFERGEKDQGRSPGAGMGLTLVKRFANLHNGDVALKSSPGRGTTVTVKLPTGKAKAQRSAS